MKLTVILATNNGGDRLERVLDAYMRAGEPPCAWSMLVVDNGSTDDTPAILTRYAARLPLVVVGEPRLGKNRALNRAIAHLEPDTDACIFSDDDAVPSQSFLADWYEAIQRRPDVVLFGGTIVPRFPSPPPRWLLRHRDRFHILFAERQRPDGIVAASQIYGANMAVRTGIFVAGYRYHERIGPNRADPRYPMGSETEFCQRVETLAGATSFFAAAPIVEHLVRPEQLTRKWIAGRAYRHGYGVGLRSNAPLAAGERVRTLLHGAAGIVRREESWWRYHWKRGHNAALAGERLSPPELAPASLAAREPHPEVSALV